MKVAHMKTRFRLSEPRCTVSAIVRQVAEQHDISADDIYSNSRRRHLAWARHEVWNRIYRETNLSLMAIADRFEVDHTSVLYGIWAHRKRQEQGKIT